MPVSAAVDITYTWTDQQTIKVAGSSLKASTNIIVAGFADLQSQPNFPGSDSERGTATVVDNASNCYFTLSLIISTTGVASAQGLKSPDQVSPSGDSNQKACTSTVYDQYTKSPITFTNSRGSTPVADETSSQKIVGVSIKTTIPLNIAAPTITATISPASIGSGPTTTTVTLHSQQTDTEYAIYIGNASVEPGKYTISDSLNIGSSTFEKTKYKPGSVSYGETPLDKKVTANVKLSNYPITTKDLKTFGPLTLVLTPPNGGQPVEVQTNAAQLGGFTNSDTTDGTTSHIDANVSGEFDNVEASSSKYRVCVKDTSICAEFTKVAGHDITVDLALTGDLDSFVTSGGIYDDKATCESGVGSFGGLICPALEGIDTFISWAEDKIENQLTVDLGTKDTRDSLQAAWRIVARLASGVLVAIALVMVIATALGSDMISPYALKKVLPRLVIGAIGIWLSWALVTTYIDIVNDLGKGMKGIMLLPFGEAKMFRLDNIAAIAGAGSSGVGATATGGIFVGLAVAGIMSAGVFGLLSMGLTALFAFVVAIFVLAIRQAVIVFLVVLAPLGVAMWILPNTQKTWKLWSGTLNKLLIMYPMIMGLLTAGKIFAWITAESAKGQQNGVDKFLMFSIALIAYVAPYFFLPALFKAAGGVFSNLTGMVSDKSKGLYDKAKGGLDARDKSRRAFKDQLKSEKQARRAAGTGPLSSFSRASMRAKGGQPITGGALTLRNRAAAQQRVQSSMAAAQDKLEEQQVQEETAKMANSGILNDREALRGLAATGSVVQRRAAINRLVQTSDDEGMRKIRSDSMASTDNRVRDMWSKVQSSKELNDAFKDSAPDILRGEGAFGKGMTTAGITKSSAKTFAQATANFKDTHTLLTSIASSIIESPLTRKMYELVESGTSSTGTAMVSCSSTASMGCPAVINPFKGSMTAFAQRTALSVGSSSRLAALFVSLLPRKYPRKRRAWMCVCTVEGEARSKPVAISRYEGG
jgi:hypothetical protein